METVEEHPIHPTIDVVKPNLVEEASADETNVCHKSNGVDCDVQAEDEHSEVDIVPLEVKNVSPEAKNVPSEADNVPPEPVNEPAKSDPEPNLPEFESKPENVEVSDSVEAEAMSEAEPVIPMDLDATVTDEPDSNIGIEGQEENKITHTDDISHEVITESVIESEKEICIEEGIITETIVEMESSISTVQFETEILVEENNYDVSDKLLDDNQESEQTNNILNELGSNIELSEVLRSSDISENVENNNSAVKQEIFNKEELLDILEGNDNMEQPVNKMTDSSPPDRVLAAEIAMQQLSRLTKRRSDSKVPKIKKEKTKSPLKASNNRSIEKKKQQQALLDETKQDSNIDGSHVKNQPENTEQQSQHNSTEQETLVADNQQPQIDNAQQQAVATDQPEMQYTDNIVKTLVMDWEDEPSENNVMNEIIKKEGSLIKDSEELKSSQVGIISKDDSIESTNMDSPSSESQTKLSKTDDDAPTRRLSRVIKKKVIFDPDNPDTFTKGKSSKAKDKETQITKEQTPSKKGKSDQSIQRSKSKSPLSKLQWKKPTGGSTKNSKQHKRLSEVDKLLMDEGAVNMIYQLTPEAPKGKKNVRTKAEFIKRIQSSSTPDTKEMKFRERKKDSKYEEGEAKRILGGKHRTSLSSSVKSPAVSEDFETHSADDSIIYRRHSSSSYSSSCMSPRRLSDVEAGATQPQSAARITQQPTPGHESDPNFPHNIEIVFKTEAPKLSSSEMINKNDCLSIKEKLNSKLSLALNKRKRENSKCEKPAKQKKTGKTDENIPHIDEDNRLNQFKFISVTFDQRLALICIKKTGLKICVEILKELEEALKYVDNRQDISITLLESQCGTLCSSLDLSLLLDENKEIRPNHAYELAESVRSLLAAAAQHRALLCCGVWGAVAGVALALVALSDVALASEGASFWLAAAAAPALPGAAALTARCRPLPQALVNDLVIFGRRLSASEALQGGLISRVLWPDRFDEQVQNIAKDIAAQPLQTILLKKKLLNLKSNSEAELTFLACLATERDLLVQYWTSVEGQELLRATLDAA